MLKVDTLCMQTQINQMQEIANRLEDISSRVAAVNRKLRWSTSINYAVRSSLTAHCNSISRLDNAAAELSRALSSSVIQYTKAEDNARSGSDALRVIQTMPVVPGYTPFHIDSILIERAFHLLGPGGQLVHDIIDPRKLDWEKMMKYGTYGFQFLCKGASTLDDYLRIGNAIGIDKAITNWLADAADLKGLSGHWSVAKNPVTAFFNNFTNSTSPINKYFKETAEDLAGKSGVGKAVASWAGIVVDGMINGIKNVQEQKASNGTMSTGRVVAETAIETGVDTVMTYAAGAVAASAIAAGAAAVGATVAMPALAVTAIGGLIWTGVNAAVEAGTGKSATEHVADFVCDTADKIGDAAKKAKKSIGKWFKKLAFA